MIRFIAVAFVLALAPSAQAMSPAPLHQPNGMITQVREACGAGRVRINGVCGARTTKRHVRRQVHWSSKAPPWFPQLPIECFPASRADNGPDNQGPPPMPDVEEH
jgi:hypothetical protein